jgi:hypothetical protein
VVLVPPPSPLLPLLPPPHPRNSHTHQYDEILHLTTHHPLRQPPTPPHKHTHTNHDPHGLGEDKRNVRCKMQDLTVLSRGGPGRRVAGSRGLGARTGHRDKTTTKSYILHLTYPFPVLTLGGRGAGAPDPEVLVPGPVIGTRRPRNLTSYILPTLPRPDPYLSLLPPLRPQHLAFLPPLPPTPPPPHTHQSQPAGPVWGGGVGRWPDLGLVVGGGCGWAVGLVQSARVGGVAR